MIARRRDGSLPTITVVTPTFNRAEYLEETIRSVLDQDYPKLEYIIADGGSSNPDVLGIIRKYEHSLSTWFSESDVGHAHAIRKGFELSRGAVLAWLCSDDTYLPGALRAVGEVFRDEDVDIVYGHHNTIDGRGRTIRNGRVVRYSPLSVLAQGNIHQASVFWTRDIYRQVGGQVGGANFEFVKYSPDSDLFLRFAKARARWRFLPRALSTFRHHPGQTCTRERDLVWAYYWKAARREFPQWTRPGVFQLLSIAMKIRRLVLLVGQGDSKYIWSKVARRPPYPV